MVTSTRVALALEADHPLGTRWTPLPPPTRDKIEVYCRESLASYKIPREVEFLDELPKSSVMKVLRRELRDRELAARDQ